MTPDDKPALVGADLHADGSLPVWNERIKAACDALKEEGVAYLVLARGPKGGVALQTRGSMAQRVLMAAWEMAKCANEAKKQGNGELQAKLEISASALTSTGLVEQALGAAVSGAIVTPKQAEA